MLEGRGGVGSLRGDKSNDRVHTTFSAQRLISMAVKALLTGQVRGQRSGGVTVSHLQLLAVGVVEAVELLSLAVGDVHFGGVSGLGGGVGGGAGGGVGRGRQGQLDLLAAARGGGGGLRGREGGGTVQVADEGDGLALVVDALGRPRPLRLLLAPLSAETGQEQHAAHAHAHGQQQQHPQQHHVDADSSPRRARHGSCRGEDTETGGEEKRRARMKRRGRREGWRGAKGTDQEVKEVQKGERKERRKGEKDQKRGERELEVNR